MNSKKTETSIKSTLAGLMLVIIMVVATVTGCSPTTGSNSSQNSGSPPAVQVDLGEGGNEAGGEHGSGGEGSGSESGNEGGNN